MESFEEKLKRVEEIIGKIQRKEVGLQDMLTYFEEGIRILKECREELTMVENKVKHLLEEQDDTK